MIGAGERVRKALVEQVMTRVGLCNDGPEREQQNGDRDGGETFAVNGCGDDFFFHGKKITNYEFVG